MAKMEVIGGTLCKSSQSGLGAPIEFCLTVAKRSRSRAGASAGKPDELVWKSLGYLEGWFLPKG